MGKNLHRSARKSGKTETQSVKGIFFDERSEYALVLLEKHGDKLKADLPGGHPNIGEKKAFRTLAREAMEETGVMLPEKDSHSTSYEKDGRVLFVLHVALTGLDIILSKEHHGAVLVPLSELPAWFEGNSHWHDLVQVAVNHELAPSKTKAA